MRYPIRTFRSTAGMRTSVAVLFLSAVLLSVIGFIARSQNPGPNGAVWTSQLGFAPGDRKAAVLGVPQGMAVQASFQVVDATTGTAVYTSTQNAAMHYPGGWVGNDATGDTYLLDFTAVELPAGSYRVESNGMASAPFRVGLDVYDVAGMRPLEFFRVQLSGVPYSWRSLDGTIGGHGADHLDDGRQAARKDRGGGDTRLIQHNYLQLPGGHLDVSGGWSDAGDYNKYMGNTPWAAYLLLLTYEEYPDYWGQVDDDHNGVADIPEVTKPALDWILQMQHTDGSVYERVFNGYSAAFDGRPDLETDNDIGTNDDRPLDTDRYADITAKAAYAWSAGYRVFGQANYLDAAIRAWDWAFAHQEQVKPQVYGGGLYFGDVEIGLTLGALELHRAQVAAGRNPGQRFIDYYNEHVRNHLAAGDWTHPSSWDYQQSYVLRRYYEFANEDDRIRIVTLLRGRWDAGIQSQAGNAYRMNDEWLYGDFGQNENSASSAGDALWVYEKTGDRRYYDYAVNQMAWIFGRNPFGESWLATQQVSEYTRTPHWRGTAARPIEGVVVPGATDRNGNHVPDYTDTGEWFYSEPTINQQAMFLRVMTALYFASGGQLPPPGDPPPLVAITSPADGTTVDGIITISANVSDAGGVASVSYRMDSGGVFPMTLTSGDVNSGVWTAQLDTLDVADGQRKITVTATDTSGQQASPFVTVNVRNSAADLLHVERVDVELNQKGGSPRIQARCDIFIHDAFGAPVAGATVSGHWTGATGDTFSVTTNDTGMATDYSDSVRSLSGLTFTCVADGAGKNGWEYDAAANQQTSGSVTVP